MYNLPGRVLIGEEMITSFSPHQADWMALKYCKESGTRYPAVVVPPEVVVPPAVVVPPVG
jgi:hypothetical protein